MNTIDLSTDALYDKIRAKEISMRELIDESNQSNLLTNFLYFRSQLFQRLIENNLLSDADLRHIFEMISSKEELDSLGYNAVLAPKMIESNVVSVKELFDACIKFNAFSFLMYTPDLYERAFEQSKISKDDLIHLWKNIDSKKEFEPVYRNASLLTQIVEQNICSFQELIDKGKNSQALQALLQNEQFFEKLIADNAVSKDDLKMLMKVLDEKGDYALFKNFSENVALIKHLLKNFLFDTEFIDKANKTLICFYNQHNDENEYGFGMTFLERPYYKALYTPDYVPEYDAYFSRERPDGDPNKDVDLAELSENSMLCFECSKLSDKEKQKLFEIVQKSKKAKGLIKEIVSSNLQDHYDFDQLKNILTKDDEKKLRTKFNF